MSAPGSVDHERTSVERLSLRSLMACPRPALTTAVVVVLAISVLGYAAILLTVFNARIWWGGNLLAMAATYLPVFIISGLVAWRRSTNRRGLFGFLATSWLVVTLVSWVPRQHPSAEGLSRLTWWTAWCIALYVVPAVIYAYVHRQKLRSYGLTLGSFRGEARIFAVMIPVIAIATWFASSQPHFQGTYPFFRGWPDGDAPFTAMLLWWVMYAATFVALEFFFRGFMVSAGYRVMGWWAIPAMAAPYCLLHLDKPVPEMVTSLFGGLILGVIALRTRSILAGVLAHVSLAIGTDLAVLGRRFLT